MALQIFPEATISIPSTLGTVTTLASSSSTYVDSTSDYTAGGYTVGASGGTAYVTFLDSNNALILTTSTSSSTSIALSSRAEKVVMTSGDAGCSVTITPSSLFGTASSGVRQFETITNTQTYTQTSTSGLAYVVVVGGGGGGGHHVSLAAGGGGSGGIASGIISLTGSVPITIGAGGAGSSGSGSFGFGSPGGATTIGNLTANGGGATVDITGGGAGGTPGGATGGNAGQSGRESSASPFPFVVSGTTGSGAGGTGGNALLGGGSGIGTGGSGGSGGTGALANGGSGYGAGGGGSRAGNFAAGFGTGGVVYIARF